MKTIEKFDEPTLDLMRTEIQNALNEIKKKYGLGKLQLGNISYDPTGASFTSKIEAKIGTDNAAYKAQQEKFAVLLGLPKEILGFQFEHKGQRPGTYVVTGFEMKKRKFPVICTNTANGQSVLFTDDADDAIQRMYDASKQK